MTTNLPAHVRQYLQEVEGLLVCGAKTRRAFMEEFSGDVQAYVLENGGDIPAAELHACFGTPEEIAQGFMGTLDSRELREAVNWKKILLIGVGVALALLVVYLGVSLFFGYLESTGYGRETIVYQNDYPPTTSWQP